MTQFRVPTATYRLQFNAGFRFSAGAAVVSYLQELGVSEVYSSPVFTATPGSQHGYDVVDPYHINPEAGGEEEFEQLSQALQGSSFGLLLDVVPNHMAATSENQWWMRVLENGPHSRFANYFDIEWRSFNLPRGLERKVLLPILGRPYGEALEEQEIRLTATADGIFVNYYDRRLPIASHSYIEILERVIEVLAAEPPPESRALEELSEITTAAKRSAADEARDPERAANSRFLRETLARLQQHDPAFRHALSAVIDEINGRKGDPRSFDRLDALLDRQWYRLAYWKRATEQINYRRFFDIIDLIGVRIEDPEVFEARHQRLLQLIESDCVTGLRIDHIDGLFDPVSHLARLQRRIAGGHVTAQQPRPFYVVVEKILAPDEHLPSEFACSGTTGYDFLNQANLLFVDPSGLRTLDRIYRETTGIEEPFEEIAYRIRKETIDSLFGSEMRRLEMQLEQLAAGNRKARDFSPNDLGEALEEVTASLSVYRTYIRGNEVSAADRFYVERAVERARARAGASLDPRIFSFLRRLLLVDPPHYAEQQRDEWLAFVLRWQQFTGRVMAKGVEDTAFYVYNRLISMNEVGGEPAVLPDEALHRFHSENQERSARWPDTLNATSTHDTKRSEDMRARINVISELGDEWGSRVRKWSRMNRQWRQQVNGFTVPDANEELLIYQSLLGVWPLQRSEIETVRDRMRAYIEKAAREAKVHSSWLEPRVEHEQALFAFIDALLDPDSRFRKDFLSFQRKVAFFGFLNSLSQLLLKIASPGIPDFYQGTELWDFSLVDPDNRRPVDFARRRRLLRAFVKSGDRAALAAQLTEEWRDGRIKMYVTWRALACRRAKRDLFARGEYVPLHAGSDADGNICAFMRRRGDDAAIAVAPRLLASRVGTGKLPFGHDVWGDAAMTLPAGAGGAWENVFTGERIEAGEMLRLADVFRSFPVALLERVG